MAVAYQKLAQSPAGSFETQIAQTSNSEVDVLKHIREVALMIKIDRAKSLDSIISSGGNLF